MKWFRLEALFPQHPASQGITSTLGNAGLGAWVRIMCYVAQHGKHEPGRAVDGDGDPISIDAIRQASGLSEEEFAVLVDILLHTKALSREAWERHEIHILGITARGDAYWKRQLGIYAPPSPVAVTESSPPREAPPEDVCRSDEIKEHWNEITTAPIRRCTTLSEARRRRALAKVKTLGLDTVLKGFAAIEHSPFCRGSGARGWLASFDWALKGDNLIRAIEGHYDPATVAPKQSKASIQMSEATDQFLQRHQSEPGT